MAFTRVVGAGIHTAANINSHNIKSTGIITATKFDGPFDTLNVTGDVDFSGNVSIGGTLTYEDVTNIDSVGLVTAREGIFLPDNKKAHFGNAAGSGDLQIYHDPSNGSYLREAGPGAFRIQGDAGVWIQSASSNQDRIVTNHNGDVQLFYSGNKKLNTTNTGVDVTGILNATGGFNLGIHSGGSSVASGPVKILNFIGIGNTFQYNAGTDTIDISIAGGAGAGGTWSTYTAGIATSKSVGVNTSTLDDNDLVGVGNSFQGLYVSNGMVITDNKLHGNHYIGTAFNGMMAGPVSIEGTLTIDGNYVVV